MGFHTYSKTGTGTSVFTEFVAWLNEHGVSCEGEASTGLLSIHDFNGMAGSFTLTSMTNTSSLAHNFTLVTDAGKELILIQGKQTSSAATSNNKFLVECFIVNNNGSLFSNSMWSSMYSVIQGGFPSLGSSYASITTDATADNYLIPLIVYSNSQKYALNNYFFSINFVEVSPGVIISDGTKQFISCGLFVFVEYNPATMSA